MCLGIRPNVIMDLELSISTESEEYYTRPSLLSCTQASPGFCPERSSEFLLNHNDCMDGERLSLSFHISVDPDTTFPLAGMTSLQDLKLSNNLSDSSRTFRTYESSIGKYNFNNGSITRVYGVWFCKSFSQYHQNRDSLIDPYEIRLQQYDQKWIKDAQRVIKLLKTTNNSKHWNSIEHIGSTAIPGMVAKPIIDVMITIHSIGQFKPAIQRFLREQMDIDELHVEIGFISKAPISNDDWGFFQVPRSAAKKFGTNEVNIHFFVKTTQNAKEKRLFRDYLNSDLGAKLKNEYGNVKLELMKRLDRGKITAAQYAREKNDIVFKILTIANEWNFGTGNGIAIKSGKIKSKPLLCKKSEASHPKFLRNRTVPVEIFKDVPRCKYTKQVRAWDQEHRESIDTVSSTSSSDKCENINPVITRL